MKEKRRLWVILAVIWMIVIFSFSAKPSDESSEESLFVGHIVGQIFVKDFENWTVGEQEAFAESINYPIRKTAHATEYAILGFLTFQAWKSQAWRRETNSGKRRTYGVRGCAIMAWVVSTAYAATDEIHQIFVPGRACMATDVMIDSAGAAAGILLTILIGHIIIGRKRRRHDGN